VALTEGVLLLGFWFAPWFSWHYEVFLSPRHGGGPPPHHGPLPQSYSGWAAAQGVTVFGQSLGFFTPLWLLPVTALALLGFAALQWRFELSQNLANAVLLALSLLALLIEREFYMQVQALPELAGGRIAIEVFWGFWGVLAMTVVAAAVGIHRLWTARLHSYAVAARGRLATSVEL
jgi:hypothetical protein